jgi:hypothetical protein
VSRLTIAQRLWLGLGLILGLFTLADFVSLRAANKVDITLQTLVSTGDERRGAGYNMQRRAQIKELETELRAAARDLAARIQAEGGRLEGQLADERERFTTSLGRYQKFADRTVHPLPHMTVASSLQEIAMVRTRLLVGAS